MSNRKNPKILLVATYIWQVVINQTFSNLKVEERHLASAIVSILHSRHVGITPELAADAARILLSTSPGFRTEVTPPGKSDWSDRDLWEMVIDILRDVARHRSSRANNTPPGSARNLFERMANNIHTPSDQYLGLLPFASFSYTIFRVVMPLIIHACNNPEVGEAMLFCEDSRGCDVLSLERYETYASKLKKQIRQLVDNDQDKLMDLFRRDRAFTLLTLTRRRNYTHHGTLPQNKLPETHIFLDLQPKIDFQRRQSRQSLDLSRRQKIYDPRWTDLGADGAKVTRRLEEFDRILKSEFIYPEIVQLDRLINEGFWVIKQPPKPIQTRDVLVIGVCPGEVASSSSSIFLKTCWFDFIMSLSRLLQHNGLKRSEFRWIEGNDLGHIKTNALLVQNLPEILTHIDSQDRKNMRYHFLKASGWFPAYIDSSVYYKPLDIPEHTDGCLDVPQFQKWLGNWFRSAWTAQREFMGWSHQFSIDRTLNNTSASPQTMFGEQKLQLERFRFIYIMLFPPGCLLKTEIEELSQQQNKADNEKLIRQKIKQQYQDFALRFYDVDSRHVTWVSDKVDSQSWYSIGRRDIGNPQAPKNEPFSAEKLAGWLIKKWLDDFVMEIQYA